MKKIIALIACLLPYTVNNAENKKIEDIDKELSKIIAENNLT
jgi:hypothetical protein